MKNERDTIDILNERISQARALTHSLTCYDDEGQTMSQGIVNDILSAIDTLLEQANDAGNELNT